MDSFLRGLGAIVGIGVGSIEMTLERQRFTFGEVVRGRLALKLSEPIEARRLVAVIEATEKRTRWTRNHEGDRVKETETVTLYEFEHQLGGAGAYLDQHYDLALPLPAPQRRPSVSLPEGPLGDALQAAAVVHQLFRGAAREIPAWRVHAYLDIPWKRNVKTGVDIVVS